MWWIQLGILPERIEPGHPEQNGRHERMHRTLKAEATSGLFLVDNTAPALILLSSVRDSDEQVTVRFRAEDAASVVAGAAWRAGFGDFFRVFPEDSSSDQFSETFTFVVKGEDARRGGFVTVAATDEAGNTTLMKVALD